MNANKLVYIILLNWNGGKDTLECLESLQALSYRNVKILLIDNDSQDQVIQTVQDKYPQIDVIQNPQNFGFVEGNNVGIRYALERSADYILLLNNDTVVDPNLIEELIAVAEQDEQVAVVSPKILNYYRRNIIESAGSYISMNFSRNIAVGYGEPDQGQYDANREVDFVSGCAFFIKAHIFNEAGLFKKDYFAYYEDMDICCQIRKKGYKLWYAHRAQVWHKVSAATGGYKNPNAIFWSTRNRFIFMASCGSWLNKSIFYPYFFLVFCPVYIIKNMLTLRPDRIKSFLMGILSIRIRGIHYSKDFPYKIAIDCASISKSKGGVGYYTLGLFKGLEKVPTRNIVEQLPYCQPLETGAKIRNAIKRIVWEQLMWPLLISWKKIDLVHYPAFVSPLFKNVKTVITIHDMAYILYPNMFIASYRLYLKFFVPKSAKKANLIFAVSENTKKDIVRFLNVEPEKVKVVYPGLNPLYKKVDSGEQEIRMVMKKFNVTKPYILSVGTLEPRKNIKTLIKAFAQLATQDKQFEHTLVVVGAKGWLYDEVFDEVDKFAIKDRIIFTNYVTEEEMLYLYNGAALFVYPSFYEGFGFPPLEAMACGVPVIASNTSSLPETVGGVAEMIDPSDVPGLASSIISVLNDSSRRQEMVEKGLENVKKFTWERFVQEINGEYNRLLGNP